MTEKGGNLGLKKISSCFFRYSDYLIDVLFPNQYRCFGCNRANDFYEHFLCESCISKLRKKGRTCRICAANLNSYMSLCDACLREKPIKLFDEIYSCFDYNEFAKDLLHRYKYLHQRYLACLFAAMLFEKIGFENMEFDVIVPIISGKNRIRKRGFDHINDICRELSKLSGKPTLRLLKRVRHDVPQVDKSKAQRQMEIEHSFVYEPKGFEHFIKNKESILNHHNLKILLVDDLYTTGSTMREAGFELSGYFKHISSITLFHVK